MNFLSGLAKLAIWKTSKNCVRVKGSEGVNLILRRLLSARLRMEFSFYRLTKNEELFVNFWALKDVLFRRCFGSEPMSCVFS